MKELLRQFLPASRPVADQRRTRYEEELASSWPVTRLKLCSVGITLPEVISPDQRIDLSGTDLRGMDLSHIDFRMIQAPGVKFDGAKLDGINFSGVDLTGASLRDCHAAGTIFTDAQMSKTDLSGARLYRANLSRARLSESVLDKTMVTHSDLSCLNLSGAKAMALIAFSDASNIDISDADLTGSMFVLTQLEGVNMERTNATDTLIIDCEPEAIADYQRIIKAREKGKFPARPGNRLQEGIRNILTAQKMNMLEQRRRAAWHVTRLRLLSLGIDPQRLPQYLPAGERLDLRGVNLQTADLRGINLIGMDLSGANMDEALLERAVLTGSWLEDASLVKCKFERAEMKEVSFVGSDLSGAILHFSILDHARFDRARCIGMHLSESKLKQASFIQATLVGAEMSYCQAIGTDFTDANLANATLNYVDLERANLTGIESRGANITNCEPHIICRSGRFGEGTRWSRPDLKDPTDDFDRFPPICDGQTVEYIRRQVGNYFFGQEFGRYNIRIFYRGYGELSTVVV